VESAADGSYFTLQTRLQRILNIVHAGVGSIMPLLEFYGFKISARIFNQIIPVEFMRKDLGDAQRIQTAIFLFLKDVHFPQNASYESLIPLLLAIMRARYII
jgi:hypothetical protein